MKRSSDTVLAGLFLLFVGSGAVSFWLYERYKQAETAFRNSISMPQVFRDGHAVRLGVHERAIADSRMHVFYISAAVTLLLAIGLLTLIIMRRSQRLSAASTEEAA